MSSGSHNGSDGSLNGRIRMFKCMRCGSLKKTYQDAATHCMSHAKEVFIDPNAKPRFPSISHYWRHMSKEDD